MRAMEVNMGDGLEVRMRPRVRRGGDNPCHAPRFGWAGRARLGASPTSPTCRPMRLSRLLAVLVLAAGLAGCAPRPAAVGPAPAAPERLAFSAGSGGANAPAQLGKPYVVLVSFDGFRYDYLDRHPTPNFDRVAQAGVRADGLVPAFPTLTFPNHYTIATGMYPGHHGLLGNTIYDPEFDALYTMGNREAVEDGRWYGGEPIWVTAETQGMVAASYFWVGSEAPVMGVHP